MKAINRSVLLGGLAAILVGPSWAQDCKPRVPDSALVKPGALIMSTNPTLPPLQFINQQGELKGMRVELGEAIAKRLCLKPEYVRIEFSAMVPGLQAGRWDMINTGIFFTEERAKMMFMIPYESQAISISIANKDAGKVTKPEDLAGKTVGVEIGGFEERKIKDLDADLRKKGLAGMTIRTFDNFATAYQALRAGQLEAVVSIDGVAKEYQDRGDFTRALSGLFPTPVALAFRNKQLAEETLKVLNEMKGDGSFEKLFNSYGVVPAGGDLVIKGPAA
ncbi:ABC transporter substrate-binding protein [Microvirga massiliensis]|uniref:ABC transporter substrate-binding protein n=1 Tax=Microvirga massiliensis TaxID=1033741 RepID=UPI00062BBBEC|nr:ABC transporter substrate-binding protein [Microvirga massiliensis]